MRAYIQQVYPAYIIELKASDAKINLLFNILYKAAAVLCSKFNLQFWEGLQPKYL